MANTLKFGNGVWANKKGSTLAYNDENGNFKPLPFTTTRSTSATRVNKEGLIEVVSNEVPRVDYTDSEDGVFLLEKAATNVIQYSESFDNTYWNKASALIESNSVISPNGTLNADKLVGIAAYGSVFKFQAPVVSGLKYTCSVFAKKDNSSKVSLRAQTNSNDTRVVFDLDNLSTSISDGNDGGYESSSIEVYPNGWFRCILTVTSASTQLTFNIYPDSPPNVSSQSSVYIFAAQLEANSYATSYIPTEGNISTRSAETANGSGNSEVFNDSEGVLFAEISALADDSTYKMISISNNGSTSNRIGLFYGNTSNQIRFFVTSNGISQADQNTTSFDVTLNNKIALKYKQNDFALWINGIEILTDPSGVTPTGLSILNFSEPNGTSNPFYGNVKDVRIYNTALTDAELQALTT